MSKKDRINSMRLESGKLPAYAWPGGYPLYYLTADNGILCPACANGENGSLASADLDPNCREDRQWLLVDCDVHYEGAPLVCDHCNAEIESAYGNPDADREADENNAALENEDGCTDPSVRNDADDSPEFSVIEYSSFFAVRHNPTGEEAPMGDGVDTLFDDEGLKAYVPGTPGFVELWQDVLNADADETRSAYFGHLDDSDDILTLEPCEPEDGDLITEDHKTFREVGSSKRNPALVVGEDEEMSESLRLYMIRENWYPTVWFLSDHGNYQILDY